MSGLTERLRNPIMLMVYDDDPTRSGSRAVMDENIARSDMWKAAAEIDRLNVELKQSILERVKVR